MTTNGARGQIWVARDDTVVYFRVTGRGDMNNCASLGASARDFAHSGYQQFVIDLGRCTALDSTFLGTLVGVALADERSDEPLTVVLLNATGNVERSIREVGIDQLVTLCPLDRPLPDLSLEPLASRDAQESPRDRARRMLAAHETLCEVDGANREIFGAFIDMLRSELEKVTAREGRASIPLGTREERGDAAD